MWKEVLNFSLKNGGTLTATQVNIWQGSLTIEQSVSADDTFELGSTHIGQMTVTLADLQVSQIQDASFSLNTEGHLILDGERVPYQTVYANVDFTDAVVVVYMAQDDDTLTQMGVYNVVQTTRDDGIISITAYDNMDKLSEVYTTSLTFPSTYGAMANEITGQLLTFDGSSTAVAEKPEAEDLTKREVLGYIAQACGYNVLCNPQGYFQFVRYNLSGFSTQGQYHEISGLYSFHHSQYPVVITGVKVIVTDEEMTTDPDTGDTVAEIVTHEYTAGTDAYQLVIEGNPLITTANGQSVADALYALYGNAEFYTGDVSHLSDLSIKASDIMKVTDRLNNTYPMLVSRTVISTGSAQNTSSYAEEPSRKITVQPSQMSRIQNSVKQAEVEAKNSKRIASNTNQYFWHTETGSDTGAHITEIPREDFLDDPTNGGGNLLARSNGIAVRDGLDELATFGANGSTIGKTDDTHLELDYHSLKGIDKEGGSSGAYFYVSDLRNAQGIATITMSFEVTESMGASYNLFLTPSTIQSVKVNGVETSDYTLDGTRLTINSYGGTTATPSAHDEIKIVFETEDRKAKAFTLGLRNDTAEVGPMSHAEGYNNEATFYCTHAEGANNSSYGACAHTEGGANSAIGNYSHAGGAYSYAFDLVGFVHGYQLQAQNPYEAVFGKYNEKDPLGKFIFAVGNGTSESNRKNALSLTKEGALETSAVRKYVPTWASGQTANNYHCVVSAGICHLFYQGQAVAHSAGASLGTLPVGARPKSAVYAPFVKMSGNVFGIIGISTAGAITVNFISDTSSAGRIYFNCSFPVVNSYEYQDNSIFN